MFDNIQINVYQKSSTNYSVLAAIFVKSVVADVKCGNTRSRKYTYWPSICVSLRVQRFKRKRVSFALLGRYYEVHIKTKGLKAKRM